MRPHRCLTLLALAVLPALVIAQSSKKAPSSKKPQEPTLRSMWIIIKPTTSARVRAVGLSVSYSEWSFASINALCPSSMAVLEADHARGIIE
jgi:hypothetical protein